MKLLDISNRLAPPGVVGEVGDELGQLFIHAYPKAYRTAYLIMRDRQDAEEAVQEAFLRVWRFRDALPAGDAIHPWIYRVLVNTCNSQLRKEIPRRERSAGDSALAGLAGRGPLPEASHAASSVAEEVTAALAGLPENLRIPAVLRYWTGLSEKDIAVAIRRRPGTVKSRLHEARRRLAVDPRIAALAPDAEEEAQ